MKNPKPFDGTQKLLFSEEPSFDESEPNEEQHIPKRESNSE